MKIITRSEILMNSFFVVIGVVLGVLVYAVLP